MTQCKGAYATFYRWLIFFGVIAFGAFLAFANDLVDTLLRTDTSHLSAVILGLFLLASLDAGRRARQLGRELCTTMQISERAQRDAPLFVTDPDRRVRFGDEQRSDSFAHQHLLLLANKTAQHGELCAAIGLAERARRNEPMFAEDPAHGVRFSDPLDSKSFAHHHLLLLANKTFQRGAVCGQELLLERLENVLGRGHETGWFLADLMIRLGLLGTVIGFIFMLGSVANVSSVDIHALQQLLTNMSAGMRIALYTTLTGLGAGILLGFQYRLLDSGVDRLMAEIIELSEVHAAAHLRRLTAA